MWIATWMVEQCKKKILLILITLFLLSKTQNRMFRQFNNKRQQKVLAKGLKDQCLGMNIKQKARMTNEYRHCLESNIVVNRLFVLVYLNRNNYVKGYNCKIYCLPKVLTVKYYQKLWRHCQKKTIFWPTDWFRYKMILRNKKVNNRSGQRLYYRIVLRLWFHRKNYLLLIEVNSILEYIICWINKKTDGAIVDYESIFILNFKKSSKMGD